jgi:hypothetical protein
MAVEVGRVLFALKSVVQLRFGSQIWEKLSHDLNLPNVTLDDKYDSAIVRNVALRLADLTLTPLHRVFEMIGGCWVGHCQMVAELTDVFSPGASFWTVLEKIILSSDLHSGLQFTRIESHPALIRMQYAPNHRLLVGFFQFIIMGIIEEIAILFCYRNIRLTLEEVMSEPLPKYIYKIQWDHPADFTPTPSSLEFPFRISSRTLVKLFPFHFCCDRSGEFVQAGPSFAKLCPQLINENTTVKTSEVVSVIHPLPYFGPFTFSRMKHITQEVCLLQVHSVSKKGAILLRGQIITEKNRIFFFGSPQFNSVDDFLNNNLSLTDFALHDHGLNRAYQTTAIESAARNLVRPSVMSRLIFRGMVKRSTKSEQKKKTKATEKFEMKRQNVVSSMTSTSSKVLPKPSPDPHERFKYIERYDKLERDRSDRDRSERDRSEKEKRSDKKEKSEHRACLSSKTSAKKKPIETEVFPNVTYIDRTSSVLTEALLRDTPNFSFIRCLYKIANEQSQSLSDSVLTASLGFYGAYSKDITMILSFLRAEINPLLENKIESDIIIPSLLHPDCMVIRLIEFYLAEAKPFLITVVGEFEKKENKDELKLSDLLSIVNEAIKTILYYDTCLFFVLLYEEFFEKGYSRQFSLMFMSYFLIEKLLIRNLQQDHENIVVILQEPITFHAAEQIFASLEERLVITVREGPKCDGLIATKCLTSLKTSIMKNYTHLSQQEEAKPILIKLLSSILDSLPLKTKTAMVF